MAATYFSLAEKALRVGASTVVDGRLQSSVPVDLADVDNPTITRTVATNYALFGPGDVDRLAPGAISRRFPAPGSSDAEFEKVALIEFGAVDLPWRYTPQAAVGSTLRPWLILVVGRRGPDEIVIRPDGRVGLGLLSQTNHDLAQSWAWAHVHDVDGRRVARILSPVSLQSSTDYVCCLVPAFDADGADSWSSAAPVTLPCYDRWSFRTGPLGDFPDLAAKLHKADLGAIEAAGGKPFGRAEVGVDVRGAVPATQVTLSTAGALRLPPGPDPDPADQPPPAEIATQTNQLSDRIVTPDGRGVVTAPRYEASFATLADQTTVPSDGWIDQLRGDPRFRGAAGLGAWNAIAWQDKIADAATAKLAGMSTADDRIRHVALGVEASRSIWRRRVPTLPTDPGADPAASAAAAGELLAVLGPVLGRLPTTAGETVLDAVTGRTPDLTRALFSSAARRALRPGPARNARASQPGAGSSGLGAAFQAANQCPTRPQDPADIRRGDVPPSVIEEVTRTAIEQAAGGDDVLAAKMLNRLLQNGSPSPGDLAAALRALTPGADGKPDPQAIAAFLNYAQYPDPTTVVSGWSGWLDQTADQQPCAPIDLVGLATVVAAAVDPTVVRPPAVQRVLATLPGITGIGPVEIEPELDLPLWSFLSDAAPDWMLPGAGDLIEGDVVALGTNPEFVEALLVGANGQTTGELRWRNIAMTSRWSPLRKFWQRSSGALDISPIKTWPAGDALGSTGLADRGHGAEAVVAFKTPLFRRYPSTVVYLFAADAIWTPPGANDVLDDSLRIEHTFTGTIGDDITFFGFPIPPQDLRSYWVVLEEPPSGYRFFAASDALVADSSAANYAHNRFAPPVRVLIGPLL